MTTATMTAAPAQRTTVPLLRLYRAELRWIFRRPRTLVVLGLLALIPVVVAIGLAIGRSTDQGPGNGGVALLTTAAANALVLPIAVLAVTLNLLLPLTTAMSAGDAVAGELAHGTLRGWLIAPVSRGRLLAVKALGVATFTLASVALMAVVGVLAGLAINGTGSLYTLSGSTLSFGAALGHIAIAVGWVTLQLWAIGAVALAVSACTEHPMLVVVSVLAGTIVSSVLLLLSAVDWLHPFLLPQSWDSITDVLRDPMPTAGLAEGAARAACYLVIGLSLAYARITTKDG
ncbi:ABC-2 type transport system permease protein [Amycolatopsis bartoniae]|uniref:Membrane protein n=1 Tax=Amycolatopsis bartoniae TaxID=941986 RepID=A0A8H9ISN9_9PSEU|nr:ABC transporter permease subunit [Amycolatopsis bartoniae]MBB2934602.1 ABC-2 type transport system permease protein [Amycolatopsis bartoniae]TVT06926.1 ABC transporter permease subunit [Amycolatopsis bartoniae]GHF46170.1 membrane protein [Amycolatopsis bartoniae]